VSYRRVWATGGGWRALPVLALALTAVTCRDALGPRGTGAGQGRVMFAPILPSEAALASFGLAIDQVRIIVVRPAADTLADTTVALPPDASAIDLNIHVALLSSPETLSVSIIALSGSQPLFTGTSAVEVTSGSGTAVPTEIPVDSYIGPGAGIASIAVLPAAPFIYLNDSLRFQVQAFDSSGAPVTQFYVSWSTSDSTIARVNGFGVVRAPTTRTSVRVRARTPGGVSDSVTATFVPLPNQMVNIAGGGQLGNAGQPLGTQLEVEVRAADNLPVGGVGVRFRALSGGAPADTTVTTDLNGRAKVTGVLGTTPGAQTFQATVPAFPAIAAVNFGATAVGTISAAMSTISTSAGSVASGGAVTLTLQGKDAAGNNITTGGDTVAFSFSGGTSTGAIGATTDLGNGSYTAAFTGAIAGTPTSIGATINGNPVTTAQPAITVTTGAIATVTVTPSTPTLTAFGQTQAFTAVARDAGNNIVATSFTWTTDAPGVATVNLSGVATAVGNGPATIKATATGGVFGTAALTVAQVVASVQVVPPLDTLHAVNDGRVFAAIAKDANDSVVAAETFTWQSSDTNVAVIDSVTGTATAVANGTTTITAKAVSNATTGSATLVVTQNVTTVAVTPATATLSAIGATQGFSGVARDSNDNVMPGVVFAWFSSDSSVATVNTAGMATAVGNGTTTITATASGISGTASLTVTQVAKQLTYTVHPSTVAAGTAIAPAVAVAASDSLGSVVQSFSGDITIAIGTNPGSGVLSGTLTQSTVLGVATFPDLAIDQPGSGYTLVATGTLPGATSTTFDVAPPASSVSWINPAGGDWSNPANWSGGVVPALGDTALVTLSGTYTVTLDVNDTVGGLKLGGASGTLTFVIGGSRVLGVGGVMQVNANAVLSATGGTINGFGTFTNAGTVMLRNSGVGKPFANERTLFVDGTTTLNGAVTTTPTSLIRIQGNGSTGFSRLTVASGFTNNGTITLTDSTSAYGAGLDVTSGTLVNAAGALIVANLGASGPRQLNAELDNQGTLAISTAGAQGLSMTRAAAAHQNSGTITVSSGALTITQSGAAPTFINSGTLNFLGGGFVLNQSGTGAFTTTGIVVIASDTFKVSGGTFNYNAGNIGGLGTVALVGGVTATFTPSFANDSISLILSSATLNGPGQLLNSAARSLPMRSSTINNPAFLNHGTLLVDGGSTIGGALVTESTSVIRVQGNGFTGFSRLTVASGFTNNGQIVLTDTTSAYGAGLDVTTGTLVNAAGASITAALGAAGPRQLNAQFSNQGTLAVATAANQGLAIARAAAVDSNSGTITVSSGVLAITQSGTSPSFTNTAAINLPGGDFRITQPPSGAFSTTGAIFVGAGDTLAVSGGAFNWTSGSLVGALGATVDLKGGVIAAFTPSFADDSVNLVLTNATLNGPGTITNQLGRTLRLRTSAVNAPFVNNGSLRVDGSSTLGGSVTTATTSSIVIQGNGFTGFSRLTVASGFTNNGQIQLTDSTSAYGAGLDVTTGTLINAVGAGIDASQGAGGPRQLNAQIYNRGTLTVDVAGGQTLTMSHPAAADSNTGTIIVGSGTLNIVQSGASNFVHTGTLTLSGGGLALSQTGAFSSAGTVTIGAGQTLAINGGTFDYAGGTIGGRGNLALQSNVVATFTPSFTNDTLGLMLINATVNGPGAVTNGTGRSLLMRSSTVNAPFTNLGTLFVEGTSGVGTSFTTSAQSLIRVRGNGTTGFSRLTAASGFTNNGSIVLTDTSSAYGAGLDVTTGVLVNAAGATIIADTGFAGSRQLNAMIDNQAGGSFVVAVAPAQNLTLSKASASHRNAGTLTLASGTLAVTGGSSSFANDTTGTIEGTGILNVAAVTFTSVGHVNPGLGTATGILTVTGNYAQGVTGTLDIALGGTTPGAQYDRLGVSANAVLGGSLNVTLTNGFTPALGDTFTVMTFVSRSGAISGLTLPGLGGGLALDTVFTPTALRLVVIAPISGHVTDITADETWAAAGTHVVTGYLRIRNGATLTIADGATVQFDSAAGLQVGDAALGEAGSLVMLGTPGSIHLTANTGSPVPGFWRGLEVQKASGPQTWRNVDIEYAGGTRPSLIDESCILLVDPAASVDLDSVHIHQCIHAGIHHFAGNLHMHRSRIDSVTGAGIQSFAGVLRLDSTAIRGSGQLGLIFGNGSVDLAGAVANKFVNNAAGSVQMFGHQLPGFGRQDSIVGNGFGGVGDTIVVDSGTVGAGVPAFTIYRQPAPYLVTGFINVWSPSGVEVSLDTGLVMAFDTSAALSVGDFADSTGASSGVSGNFVSLGTAASPVLLRNRPGRPGWQGLFLGAQSGTPVVRHMRLVGGGYQPQLGQVCQNCLVKTTGFFEPLNANLYVDAPTGSAPFVIELIDSDSSHFYGIVVKRAPPQGFQVRDNTIQRAAVTGLVVRAPYNPLDAINGNTLTGNHYALDVTAGVLPLTGPNTLAGNLTDTLLLHGGTLPVSDTLPQLGFRWRVTQPMVVDGAEFTVMAGDTVVFDDPARLIIGGASPAALQAAGTVGSPIVFTVTPGGDHWFGLEFANLLPSTVSHVIVEKAGGSMPCFGDCNPIPFGSIRYTNVSASGLTLDAVTVRQARVMALDVDSAAGSPVLVQNSQFYQNPFSPMIKSLDPLLLSIHGSDLYHYSGQVIQTTNAGTDSIDALGNWWGDVGGLEKGFEFNDSVGRGSLWFNAVRFDLAVPGPQFPVGPAAELRPVTDTVLSTAAMNAIVGDPDSIRVRSLDAEGRGVGGVTIGWGTSSGSFAHPGLPTDLGGRAGGVWTTDTVANLQFVQATVGGLIGSPVTWAAFLQPGPTVSVNFQLIQSLSAGGVSLDSNSVAFTSTLRPAALVTNARDQYGNPTAPQTGFFFTDVPVNIGFQNYGLIDSVKYDTVFFHPTVSTPATFQLHGNFLDSTGTTQDSVLISMLPVAAGVRLVVDSFDFHSLCPVGGPYNILCRQTFVAFLVDSAGSLLPPDPAYQFSWTNSNAGSVSDSTYGPMNEFVDLTAHANGTAAVIVQQISGLPLVPDRDTLTVNVNQVLANIAVTPDTVSAGLGDTVTFSATATDHGGSPMPGAIGWRQDAPAGQYVTIIDFPSANSIRVRIDSTYPSFPRDAAVITAFTQNAQGDTLLAGGVIYNPIFLERAGVPGSPQGSAVDPVLNQAYVVGLSGSLAVFDGVGDTLIATIPVGSGAASVAANPLTGKVYVSNSADGTVTIIDGVSRSVMATITVGTSTGGIAVDTAKDLIYVGSLINVGGTDVPFLSTIDGPTNAVLATDTVRLRGASAPGAIAVNAANGRAFVIMRNDSLGVVDLVAKSLVDSLGNLGFNLGGVAVNTLTDRVYVGSASEIRVIDGTPGVDTVFTAVFLGANSAQGLSVNEARNKIYVAHASNTLVYEIDGVSNLHRFIIVGTSIFDTPQSTAVNPVTGKVYVPHANALTVMKYFSN
jgi:YVTN family beta-propeller protein